MDYIRAFIILVAFSFSNLLYSQTLLQFKYTPDSRQSIECDIEGQIFVNSVYQTDYTQEYRTVRNYGALSGNFCNIQDTNYIYSTNSIYQNDVRRIVDNYSIDYKKDNNGVLVIRNNMLLPTLRNIPFLPSNPVNVGDSWTANGFEVQDFFNEKNPSVYPITVTHKLVRVFEHEGIEVAQIDYQFEINIVNDGRFNIDRRIQSIIGVSYTACFFDIAKGTRIQENYQRHYIITVDGNKHEFKDGGTRLWNEIELMNKEDMITDIQEDLTNNGIEDTTVNIDERGVRITLENILFEADSSFLRDTEKERLEMIAEILKRYMDRGVMIVGHTTDLGTELGRTALSFDRAKAVLDYLSGLNAINTDRSSYTGVGGREPIADNNTEEGRARNRRVDIFILEE